LEKTNSYNGKEFSYTVFSVVNMLSLAPDSYGTY